MFVNHLFETVPYESYHPLQLEVPGVLSCKLPGDEYEQLRQLLYDTRTILLSQHIGNIYFANPKSGQPGVVKFDSVIVDVSTNYFSSFAGVLNYIIQKASAKPRQYFAFYVCHYDTISQKYGLRVSDLPPYVNDIIRRRFREDRMDDIIAMVEEN